MKRGSTTGAAAKIEAWRRAGKELRDELVSTRDRLTVELQAAEAALAELDGGTAPSPPPPVVARAAKVARVKAPAVAFVAATPGDGNKRRRGTGGVVHNGRSWKYKIGIGGEYRYGDTFPTQEEALAQLDAFLAARSPASAAPPKLAEKTEKEDTGASPWLPMGPGWGKPDENGLAKHLSCNGRGCDGCKGNGYGRAKLRERKAA